MIFYVAIGIGAFLGYRRWGGAKGIILGGLLGLAIYYLIAFVFVMILMLSGDQIQEILTDIGSSV